MNCALGVVSDNKRLGATAISHRRAAVDCVPAFCSLNCFHCKHESSQVGLYLTPGAINCAAAQVNNKYNNYSIYTRGSTLKLIL